MRHYPFNPNKIPYFVCTSMKDLEGLAENLDRGAAAMVLDSRMSRV